MMTQQIPFNTVNVITAANTVLIQGLIPVSVNSDTEVGLSVPFPKTGRNNSKASRISSVPQVNVKILSTLAFFSSSAAEMISSGQINSSIETEKYREICFNESRLG